MNVYLDDMRAPFGRMIMFHMVADETEELLRMATAIGLAHKRIQKKGTYKEHFYVSLGFRAKAVTAGAVEVTQQALSKVTQAKRKKTADEVRRRTIPSRRAWSRNPMAGGMIKP